VATWDDVRRVVAALPGTEETASRGLPQWKVRGKLLVWERPLRAADRAALGEAAPDGEVLGARVPDEGVKHALVAASPEVFFTTPHFDGYPAVLARLDALSPEDLEELVVEAWLDRAPKRLARELANRTAEDRTTTSSTDREAT
jgi:hypothetical protein